MKNFILLGILLLAVVEAIQTNEQKKILKCQLEQMKCNRACKGNVRCFNKCQAELEDCSGYEKWKPNQNKTVQKEESKQVQNKSDEKKERKPDTSGWTDEQVKIMRCHKEYTQCIKDCQGNVPCFVRCQGELEDCSGYKKWKPKNETTEKEEHKPTKNETKKETEEEEETTPDTSGMTDEQIKIQQCRLNYTKCNHNCNGKVSCFNRCQAELKDCSEFDKGNNQTSDNSTNTEEEHKPARNKTEGKKPDTSGWTDEQVKIMRCHKEYTQCIKDCQGNVPCFVRCQGELEDCSGYEKWKPKNETTEKEEHKPTKNETEEETEEVETTPDTSGWTDEQVKIMRCHKEYTQCIKDCQGNVPCFVRCQGELEDCSGYEKWKPKNETTEKEEHKPTKNETEEETEEVETTPDTSGMTDEQKKILQCHSNYTGCIGSCKSSVSCFNRCQAELEDCSGYDKGDNQTSGNSTDTKVLLTNENNKGTEENPDEGTDSAKKGTNILKCHLEQMKCNRACKGNVGCFNKCQAELEDCSGYKKWKPKKN